MIHLEFSLKYCHITLFFGFRYQQNSLASRVCWFIIISCYYRKIESLNEVSGRKNPFMHQRYILQQLQVDSGHVKRTKQENTRIFDIWLVLNKTAQQSWSASSLTFLKERKEISTIFFSVQLGPMVHSCNIILYLLFRAGLTFDILHREPDLLSREN